MIKRLANRALYIVIGAVFFGGIFIALGGMNPFIAVPVGITLCLALASESGDLD